MYLSLRLQTNILFYGTPTSPPIPNGDAAREQTAATDFFGVQVGAVCCEKWVSKFGISNLLQVVIPPQMDDFMDIISNLLILAEVEEPGFRSPILRSPKIDATWHGSHFGVSMDPGKLSLLFFLLCQNGRVHKFQAMPTVSQTNK